MPQVNWSANQSGEYWIDVSLGGHPLQVLIDSGLIDHQGRVGFSVCQNRAAVHSAQASCTSFGIWQ